MAYISKITLPDNNGTYDLKDTNAVHHSEVTSVNVPSSFSDASTSVLNGVNAQLLGDTALTATSRENYTGTDYSLNLGSVLTSITSTSTTVASQTVSSYTQVVKFIDSNE